MSTNGSLVVANPDDYNLALVTSLAKSLGLHFAAKASAKASSVQAVVLAEHQSKPLTDIIKITLKESDNLYAQQLLRSLGLKTQVDHRARTLEERGIDYLLSWLDEIGVARGEIILYDGCGLSRKNCVTQHALNMVLKHMAGPNLNGPYLGLLTCQSNTSVSQSSFCFKTGAMDSVRSVAGVMRTADNKAVAISILVNGHGQSVANLKYEIANLVNELESLALSGSRLHCPDTPTSDSPETKPHGIVTRQKSKSSTKKLRHRSKRTRRNLP